MAYRYFAVDVGDKRVGLAVSDALGITAQGIETYNRTGDDEKDGEYIRKCAERYAPCRIVFGMPRNMDGSYGFASETVGKASTTFLTKGFPPLLRNALCLKRN